MGEDAAERPHIKRYCQVENGEQQRAAETELAMDTPIAQDNA